MRHTQYEKYLYGGGNPLNVGSKTLALLTWSYFMIFYPFSGGWTYIRSEGKFIRNSDPYPA
jgi:hypothetical protein